MKSLFLKILSIIAFLVAITNATAPCSHAQKIKVFVSILPQACFVERIGGPYVEIGVLVGPGQSPATYEPTPKQMAMLARSRLYFLIGTPFEKTFVPKALDTFKTLKLIDTRKGIKLRYFKRSSCERVPDPHIWLDPKLVKIQAENICEGLIYTDPAHAKAYKDNLRAFCADLDGVDAKISTTLAPLKGGRFYVFHPAFGYFGDSYGLTQVAVEIEGKSPSAKQLANLIKRAKKDNVKVIFVQPQFAKKDARVVAAAIGGAVVPMNPLARDYLKNLEHMAAAIRDALSG